VQTPVSKKNGISPTASFMPDAERKEAERSEADWSAASGSIGANPVPPQPAPAPNPEVVADAKRRTFALEYKMRILAEADAAKDQPGAVGALLRREGLYSSHLTTWRKEREAGVRRALTPKTRGPKPKLDPQQEQIRRLRRENEKLTEALRKAELIIEVQKKVGTLLGWPLPECDSENEKP
jgi:transposase